jgi:hypothetical protein
VGGDVDEVASVRADPDGRVALRPVAARTDSVWMEFNASFEQGIHDAKGELYFTDYSSAGEGWDEASRFRVWIPQLLDPSRSGPG